MADVTPLPTSVVLSAKDFANLRHLGDPRLRKDADGRYVDPLPTEDDPTVTERIPDMED